MAMSVPGRPCAPVLPGEDPRPGPPLAAGEVGVHGRRGQRQVAHGNDPRRAAAVAQVGQGRVAAAVAEGVELFHEAQVELGLLGHEGAQAQLEGAVPFGIERAEGQARWARCQRRAGARSARRPSPSLMATTTAERPMTRALVMGRGSFRVERLVVAAGVAGRFGQDLEPAHVVGLGLARAAWGSIFQAVGGGRGAEELQRPCMAEAGQLRGLEEGAGAVGLLDQLP